MSTEPDEVEVDVDPEQRRHSVSSISTYLRCAAQWHYRYVIKPDVEWVAPEHVRRGTAVHAAMEGAFLARADYAGPVTSMAVFEPQARAALDIAWADLDLPTDHGAYDRVLEQVQATLDRVEVPERAADVLGVERKILSPTPDGTLVIGYVDLLLRVARDVIKVRDWKTTSRARTPVDLVHDLQLNTYGWFEIREFGASTVVLEHFYPPIQTAVTVEAQPVIMQQAIDEIEATAEMIAMDSDFPTRVGKWCDDCAYRSLCPEFAPAPPAPGQAEEAIPLEGPWKDLAGF